MSHDIGTIPAKDAVVCWGSTDGAPGQPVSELFVFPHGRQPEWADRLSDSRGACDSDWMMGDVFTTPLGLFLEIAVTEGFASADAKIKALRQFLKIEGQDWPASLLSEITGERPEDILRHE